MRFGKELREFWPIPILRRVKCFAGEVIDEWRKGMIMDESFDLIIKKSASLP